MLNKDLTIPTFKMEEVIRHTICRGERIVSIDLTDASVFPKTKKSQNLLRFHMEGQSYQFQTLPFSFAVTSFEFPHFVKEVKLVLKKWEFMLLTILDDW